MALLNGLVLKQYQAEVSRGFSGKLLRLVWSAFVLWQTCVGKYPSWGNCGRFRHARVTQLEQGSQCAPYGRFEPGLRARLRMPYYLGHCRTPSWGDHSPAVLRGVPRMSSTSLRIGCFRLNVDEMYRGGDGEGMGRWDGPAVSRAMIDGNFKMKIGRLRYAGSLGPWEKWAG